ncbi:GNAT family N-acetyltransferase [Rossellomorea oryzaecorticis]|uniref:GNAT family N-acetyltransferase n=1 Tax=Rossellomorea oryzaecorticis TaxID=1396505 RepID=A0ABU9K812_9BACI
MKAGLLEKIKIIKGEGFVTIEDTNHLTNKEFNDFIPFFMNLPYVKTAKNVNILVDSKFNNEVDIMLEEYGFRLHDENLSVYKDLNESSEQISDFSLKDLENISINEFKRVWEESMKGSLNSPSSLTMEEQMRSVEVELGPRYKRSCMVACENNQPIGVVIPHIEPGTLKEGRLFYFGLIPEERGKGKSLPLHQHALNVLKNVFKAEYYIGSTSRNNVPMVKTFEHNGCSVLTRNRVYKKNYEAFN